MNVKRYLALCVGYGVWVLFLLLLAGCSTAQPQPDRVCVKHIVMEEREVVPMRGYGTIEITRPVKRCVRWESVLP